MRTSWRSGRWRAERTVFVLPGRYAALQPPPSGARLNGGGLRAIAGSRPTRGPEHAAKAEGHAVRRQTEEGTIQDSVHV